MAMDAATLIETQRRVTKEHITAEDAGDWDRTMKTFVKGSNAAFDAVPMGTVFRGHDQIRGFYNALSSAMPDASFPSSPTHTFLACRSSRWSPRGPTPERTSPASRPRGRRSTFGWPPSSFSTPTPVNS